MMNKALNTENAIRKRKYQDALKLCAHGILVFAFWAIAKFLLQWITLGSDILGNTDGISGAAIAAAVAGTIVLVIFDCLLRLHVWRAVCREAEGKHAGNGFLVVTVLLLILNLAEFILSAEPETETGLTASFITESILALTDDIILVGILVLTVRFRNYGKLSAEGK